MRDAFVEFARAWVFADKARDLIQVEAGDGLNASMKMGELASHSRFEA
jgi:hypothetical protein